VLLVLTVGVVVSGLLGLKAAHSAADRPTGSRRRA